LLHEVRTTAEPIFCDDSFLVRQALEERAAEVPVIDHTIYWSALHAGRIPNDEIGERWKNHEYTVVWLFHDSPFECSVREAGYVLRETGPVFRKYVRPEGIRPDEGKKVR
jgi:hypothetical protein